MGPEAASAPAQKPFRRHGHPQPFRKVDRAWLERIVAGGGVYVADLPAPFAERLIGKTAIVLLVSEKDGQRPRWLGTVRGVAKPAEPARGSAVILKLFSINEASSDASDRVVQQHHPSLIPDDIY